MRTSHTLIGAFVLFGATLGPAPAADIVATPHPPVARSVEIAGPADFASRETVLLLIRETFNVLDADKVRSELASGVDRRGAGPTEADQLALDRALLAEGSYYLVSLRYLILAGGAAWPADRPARYYDEDSLVKLAELQDRLFEAVATRADPLPIFLEAQQIWALTEGYKKVPERRDVFGHRDRIVEDVWRARRCRSAAEERAGQLHFVGSAPDIEMMRYPDWLSGRTEWLRLSRT